MRWIAGLLAALLAVGGAGAEEFKNGGFAFSTGGAPAFVDERPLPEAWLADAPGARDDQWRYWRYDVQADRRPGQDITYFDYAFEPRSQGNIADAGRFEIPFNPEYQALTLHRVELRRNGGWQSRLKPSDISIARRERQFEQDISDGQVAALIVIEDVRPGDVVRISWTVAGSNPILAGQSSEQVRLAYGHPILDVRLRALYPPGTEIATHVENGAPEPRVSRRADATVVEAGAARVERLQEEGDYPAWYQPYPLVQFAPRRSWGDVVRWALPLYPDQAAQALPEDLERRIEAWKAIPTASGRLRAALRAVQDEVRYFGVETGTSSHRPRPPELVWRRRYGDCKDKAWLLVTLLQRLGVRAEPALVDTVRGRSVRDYAPAANLFNHVIVRAHVDGKPVFVDPTLRLQGGDPAQGDLSGYGTVLLVLEGSTGMAEVAAPVRPAAGVDVKERYLPDGEGMRLEVSTEYRGVNADRLRRSLDEERLEDVSRRYREYYAKRFGAVEALQAPAVQDDREENVLVIREAYRLASPWQQDGTVRGLDMEAQALAGVADLPARSERHAPLYFARPGRYVQEVTLESPKGWTARFEHEDDRVATEAFDYRRTLQPTAGGAVLRHELDVAAREVPLSAVPAHVAALRKVGDGLHSRLRYLAPASADAGERQSRLQDLLRDVMKDQ
jgi:transglutaminase-like putative cysteine protease